jgi:von Willebrand factor type A domain
MIRLTCTHCRATLEMDDGFAGGACRCRHCGTIQTVPSHLKNKSGAKRPVRTLYQSKADPAVPSSGLDQLADVVAGSGLGSSRLQKDRDPMPLAQAEFKPPRNVKPLLIGAGAIIVVLCGALILAMTSGHNAAPQANPTASATPASTAPPPPAARPAEGNFCGIPLTGETTIYVLDRGDSTRDSFEAEKTLTLKSIQSLGDKRQFQIIFWNNGKDAAFPKNWPVYATNENINAAQRAMDDVTPHGKTDITSALKSAIAENPADIVIATGKGWDLDDSFVKTVDKLCDGKDVTIDTVSLGDPGSSTALQTVAASTHGTFKTLSATDLNDLSH